MTYAYFSRGGKLLPADQAVIPLDNVEYSYGFGVYETIRVSQGHIYFLAEHCQRLLTSAEIIGLEHRYTAEFVARSVQQLADKNQVDSCNLKVLLVGGKTPETAELYIMCLNPLFTDRKLYRQGVHCITQTHERSYPHAKTLNMLSSYLAYRDAKQAGAYDCLLVNRRGCLVEGTRSNFFAIQGRRLISPPAEEILLGVTRDKVIQVARAKGYEVVEQDIPLASLSDFDGAFITSTSSKIMPLRSVDQIAWPAVPPALAELMQQFESFMAEVRSADHSA